MLNILNIDTELVMLGSNVDSYMEAYYWLEYYRETYGPGAPFPNGEGVYDYRFIIVRQVDERPDVFRAIQ